MAADEALIRAVREGLAAAGDPARAPQMQAYMKSAMPFRGVAAPEVRRVTRHALAAHPLPSADAWAATVRALFADAAYREERYAAIGILDDPRHRTYRTPVILPLLQELVFAGAWWDLVDPIATHAVGELLRAHPDAVRPVVLRWSTDDDRWLRRTAIICQVLARASTDRELLRAVIEPNVDERGFFVRKAIGWALRAYAHTDPDWVRAEVEAWGDRLSGLSRREALKHL